MPYILEDVVSVKDFGAAGDGIADDTAAIQAALTAVGSALTSINDWIEVGRMIS